MSILGWGIASISAIVAGVAVRWALSLHERLAVRTDVSAQYFDAYLRWRDAALACERSLHAEPHTDDVDALRAAALAALDAAYQYRAPP